MGTYTGHLCGGWDFMATLGRTVLCVSLDLLGDFLHWDQESSFDGQATWQCTHTDETE